MSISVERDLFLPFLGFWIPIPIANEDPDPILREQIQCEFMRIRILSINNSYALVNGNAVFEVFKKSILGMSFPAYFVPVPETEKTICEKAF